MRGNRAGLLSLTVAAFLIAGASAEAQGKGQGKANAGGKAKSEAARSSARGGDVTDQRRDGVIWRERRDGRDVYGGRTVYGNGTKVPPGLAKKPGQMPPGQYKKRYSTQQGASVLGDILRGRGYPVQRISPYGDGQAVYYRRPDGTIARATVSQRSDRLGFSNVPSVVLREVLARLY
jgi:hypothetical protein